VVVRFSQRIGIKSLKKLAQRESIDDELRGSLWSLLELIYWENYKPVSVGYNEISYVRRSNIESLVIPLWLHYFKKPVDTIDEYWEDCRVRLRKYFFAAEWYEVYDFVEFIAKYGWEEKKDIFIKHVNSCLERENSAYRFVNGLITEITSGEEISEVEAALSVAERFSGVKVHLQTALALMSDRKDPDYRNSIKESISAVEALAKKLSGDESGTLGAILRSLEKSKKLHPALKTAYSSLYGYTNDADGIRHAMLDESNLTKADARFMLICCSAFINYAFDSLAIDREFNL
jgi:hypothetical protein